MVPKWIQAWKRRKRLKEMDLKPVTERQRELLVEMLHFALVEIRLLCESGQTERAAALADVFHNLPSGVYSENFSFPWFGRDLESYQSKHGSPQHKGFAYTDMLEKALREEDLYPPKPS